MDNNWTIELADQLTFDWEVQLRPRWAGLTDEEYLWEPVRDMWSVRPRGTGRTPQAVGDRGAEIDYERPEPKPTPVTTIAWRMGHLLVGVFGERNARYFGGPPVDYASYDYPLTADDALAQLDDGYRLWNDGVRGLTAADLAARCREPGFETDSMAMLILHINRELGHHGAEINLLRDLYLWR
jgi:hypothetical protein